MKKVLLALLCLSVCSSLFPQETRASRRGQAAGYASRDATTLSMMGWGFILAGGVAAICTLVSNDTATTTSH